jgi:uridine phosphorylase
METFHLYHLAVCWQGRRSERKSAAPPLTTRPVNPALSGPPSPTVSTLPPIPAPGTVIRAAAAQMVFASRTSQEFITPEQVAILEDWTGKVSGLSLVA